MQREGKELSGIQEFPEREEVRTYYINLGQIGTRNAKV